MAKLIASKSPVAVQGSKINLIHSRDHGVLSSLKYMVIKSKFSLKFKYFCYLSLINLSLLGILVWSNQKIQ